MLETVATAALLLVPFLAIVVVGAVAVALHDGVAAWWTARRRGAPVAAWRAPLRARRAGGLRPRPVLARPVLARRAPTGRPSPVRPRPLVADR